MPWALRGLRDGVVTTPYPRRPDGYGDHYHGAVVVIGGPGPADAEAPSLCPTGAISTGSMAEAHLDGAGLRVDRGRCILCGHCVAARPERFAFEPGAEVAAFDRLALVVPEPPVDSEALAEARAALGRRVRALRRSVHVRHVDAGSDGAEEWEVAALQNPVYDVQRLGVFFTASPRHADLLLVTGAGSAGMLGPLRRAYEAMPEPRVVVAAGVDAASGGLLERSYATAGGVGATVPVDVWVPGSPPSPFSLLHGILVAVGVLGDRGLGR